MPVTTLLTEGQVAERCAVSRASVSRWIAAGKLRAVRVGTVVRVTEDALGAFLAAHESGGAPRVPAVQRATTRQRGAAPPAGAEPQSFAARLLAKR